MFVADIGMCPEDYEVLTATFWGTSAYCEFNDQKRSG